MTARVHDNCRCRQSWSMSPPSPFRNFVENPQFCTFISPSILCNSISHFSLYQHPPPDRSNGTLTTSKSSPAMIRINRSSAITIIYANDIKQNLSKNIFLLLGCCHYDGIMHCCFSYYHSQRPLFSPMKNNFSMTLTPTEKRDIHIEELFCTS